MGCKCKGDVYTMAPTFHQCCGPIGGGALCEFLSIGLLYISLSEFVMYISYLYVSFYVRQSAPLSVIELLIFGCHGAGASALCRTFHLYMYGGVSVHCLNKWRMK